MRGAILTRRPMTIKKKVPIPTPAAASIDIAMRAECSQVQVLDSAVGAVNLEEATPVERELAVVVCGHPLRPLHLLHASLPPTRSPGSLYT